MAQKICCGGFELGDGLELDGKILNVEDGAGLPSVTSSDNGKLLGVVNGQWNKVQSPLIVTANTTLGGMDISIDKQYSEIKAALPNVSLVEIFDGSYAKCVYYIPNTLDTKDGKEYIDFARSLHDDNEGWSRNSIIRIFNDESVSRVSLKNQYT